MGQLNKLQSQQSHFLLFVLTQFVFFQKVSLNHLSNHFYNLLGKITAAAVTGPARLPLPASSIPASKLESEKLLINILENQNL